MPPRLRSQYERHSPERGYPQFGRDEMDRVHAIFVIARALAQLGLNDWLAQVMHWLGNYDGLETMLEDWEDPVIGVRKVLLDHITKQESSVLEPTSDPCEMRPGALNSMALKQAIVADCLKLDFVSYCASWDAGVPPRARRVWVPLRQSWMEFRESREGEEHKSVWYSESAQPRQRRQLSDFLLLGTLPTEREGA